MYFVNGVGWTATPYLYRDDDSDYEGEYDREEYFDREEMEWCGTDDDDYTIEEEIALEMLRTLFE
jgi:hypothetical protein